LTSAASREEDDIAALAKGGRTNVFGFLLRLAARIPFLFIAGRIYGADALGRFAYAVLVVEFAAQFATLGLKRGLAGAMAQTQRPESHVVADALVLTVLASVVAAAGLMLFPQAMFPNSSVNGFDHLLPLIIIAVAGSDVALSACAWRFDIGASVRARAIIEPWVISIGAFLFSFYSLRDGLLLSYVASMAAALVASVLPLAKHFEWPHGWRPEWGSRRLDMAILGLFASPAIVGIYYVAQQVASLPQKLKTSFEPILGPVITRNLQERNYGIIARQVSQVGFWIIATQAGIALALGIPGEAVMGLVGPQFVVGAVATGLLLAAEVAASTAVVSESALVYMARHRNLMMSLGMIAVQAALSFVLIYAVRALGYNEAALAAAPALALVVALGMNSWVKSKVLGRLLGHKITTWRPALLLAVGAATGVGVLVVALPHSLEWVELVFGVPAILAVYAAIIWRFGFGPEDRTLFASNKAG
jgi:O-antigen/teichoic acid export membrane protein